MASSDITSPIFPEDVERAINDALLYDARDMWGTMSLIASRFNAWTKPIIFRTVLVRRSNNWTQRIIDLLLPNAPFIRTLALDLPLARGSLSDSDIAHLRQLLEAAHSVQHLAVTWHLWARLAHQCGALRLSALYLIWDRTHPASPPSLAPLQHPALLTDLTLSAPADPATSTPFRPWGELFLPEDIARANNLAYVAYAADRTPLPTIGALCEDEDLSALRGVMFVLVDVAEEFSGDEDADELVKDDLAVYARFSTAYVRFSNGVLGEWVAKMEGRPSVLVHPPPHAVESVEEEG
ncbi:hypothetical protein B0H19DRAFT_1181819 [Mycena capillaripes]|nr:hypothetical protein B0H19DRAFT_1181819 [Mycena capillaripes]